MKKILTGLEEIMRVKLKMFRDRSNLGNYWVKIWWKNIHISKISANN